MEDLAKQKEEQAKILREQNEILNNFKEVRAVCIYCIWNG